MPNENNFASDLQSPKMKSLLSCQEAASYLGIAEQTMRQQRMKGGGIKFVKVGRLIRYRASDLEAYLEARTFDNTSQMGGAI